MSDSQVISFFKYHGTGNDFVMIDNREGIHALSSPEIVKICDRHFGVGSDGLVLIEPHETLDFYMNFFNPDASQSFCGNGSRCAVAFAQYLGMIGEQAQFEAVDGNHEALISEALISVKMKDVKELKEMGSDFFLDTGSPHYIQFVEQVDDLELRPHARAIRYNETWRNNGVNVNVVETISKTEIKIRTYERGVEDETLSCGTGVTAAALAKGHMNRSGGEILVGTRGGELRVTFDYEGGSFSDIWLKGPAVQVFKGEMVL